MLSHKCIDDCNWDELRNSQVVPFTDEDHQTLGCQLILKQNKQKQSFINLIDDMKYQNLYTSKS